MAVNKASGHFSSCGSGFPKILLRSDVKLPRQAENYSYRVYDRHQFFPTNKQYVKIKLMQNETNRWSIFLSR